MRHRNAGRKLGRTSAHRKAMMRNMVRSLVTHERIKTTEPKAKELRKVADKLVTLALQNDVHARRQAYKVLENHQLVQKLFDEIGPRFAGVPGGYTRVVKMALPRPGDGAALAVIEFSLAQGETKAAKAPKAAKPAPAPAAAPAAAAPEAEAGPEPSIEAEEHPVTTPAAAEPETAEAAPVEEAAAAPEAPAEPEAAAEEDKPQA